MIADEIRANITVLRLRKLKVSEGLTPSDAQYLGCGLTGEEITEIHSLGSEYPPEPSVFMRLINAAMIGR